MTRKDYVKLAAALAAAFPGHNAEYQRLYPWRCDCRALANALAADNPRFDYLRFLDACGGVF